MLTHYRPKRSFSQGNIFTPVCHSVHRGGVPAPNFRGGACSKFSGGCLLQIFGGGGVPAPNFRGGACSKFSGGPCSKFSGGVPAPNFWGVHAPNFRGGWVPAPNFRGGGSSNFRNTVTVRPVRILLECILVCFYFWIFFLHDASDLQYNCSNKVSRRMYDNLNGLCSEEILLLVGVVI